MPDELEQRKPAYDLMEPRALELIKSQVAKGANDAEVAYFLELASHYDLDPFAKEVWCSKRNGQLFIMVGRDGLRKIAKRNGFRLDGDVVRQNDEFSVGRNEHGRVVTHTYGKLEERGPIVGAWCEAIDQQGVSHGYFFAPLHEFKPATVDSRSPWAKQESVMILAAAERQAARQATPLAGLLMEGEDESAAAVSTGTGSGEPAGIPLPKAVEEVIARAERLGHAGLADRATVEMLIGGQPEEFVEDWVSARQFELGEMESMRDAEIVPEIPGQEKLEVEG